MAFITNSLRDIELRQRIAVTLLVLLIYKIGIYITVPGIDRDILKILTSTDALALGNLVSGGALTQFSVLALGVMPYITASIIVQLMSHDIVPLLSEWKRQGEHGQQKIKKLTFQLSIVFALVQGFGMTYGLNRFYSGLLINDSIWNMVLISVILTIGTIVLVLLGEYITKKGIGNGMSVIIFGSIMMSLPSAIATYYESTIVGAGDHLFIEVTKTIIILAVVLLLLAFVVFIHKSERRIPIKHTVQKGRMQLDSDSQVRETANFIPFKIMGVGVIPVIFAVSIVIVPTSMAQMFPEKAWSSWVSQYLALDSITGMLLYASVIIFFNFFYTFIQMNPEKIAGDLNKNGSFVPGIRPGEETENYLKGVLKRVTLVGSFVLAFIAIIPTIITFFVTLPMTVTIGGVSMIIVVNVGLDVMARIQSFRQSQEYKGILSNHNKYKDIRYTGVKSK